MELLLLNPYDFLDRTNLQPLSVKFDAATFVIFKTMV